MDWPVYAQNLPHKRGFEIELERLMVEPGVHPPVTEILKLYQDFSMINPAELGLAADRGAAIHSALALPAPAPGVHLLTVLPRR